MIMLLAFGIVAFALWRGLRAIARSLDNATRGGGPWNGGGPGAGFPL